MAELVVESPEGITLRHEIAGAGSRSAAALIDFVIWFLVLTTLVFAFEVALGGVGGFAVWILAGWLLTLIGYQVFFALIWNGATPGKRLLGLAVADQNGLPATPLQHVLRSIFWPLEALPMPVPLAMILMAATPRHQRLGDQVSGTLVLRLPQRRLPGEPFANRNWSELPSRRLELVPAHAARFDGEDVDFLRELIGRTGIETEAHDRLLVRAARSYSARLELPLEPGFDAYDARAILSELYVFLREMRTRSRG